LARNFENCGGRIFFGGKFKIKLRNTSNSPWRQCTLFSFYKERRVASTFNAVTFTVTVYSSTFNAVSMQYGLTLFYSDKGKLDLQWMQNESQTGHQWSNNESAIYAVSHFSTSRRGYSLAGKFLNCFI
jgi:hypothetical protein